MPQIILATLNAKYIHASLGLRYLYANLGELQSQCKIQEYTIKTRAIDIVEQILESRPSIVGFGVYIWNTVETEAVISQLKTIAPEIKIILGGPEVSYETEGQSITRFADYIVTGAADLSFKKLCQEILEGNAPEQKVLRSKPVELRDLQLPYHLYDDADLKHRLLYVEASRGCPFKCEFCLSSLDKTSYPFELQRFLEEMETLYKRGARHFKFVDRTFNLKIKTTLEILNFFLERMDDELFLHFEVIPDHLPEKLKETLKKFPAGTLQFEVGIQTFNDEVQSNISRKQNNDKSKDNLVWLRDYTTAHIHADLIFGLPGETLDTFRSSFNELYQCRPHEIQMGILKRLKGSPIIRHTEDFDLRFNPLPPFNILSNDRVDFVTMQRINRFARYWDMIGNSGRFKFSLPHLLSDRPFDEFLSLTDWIFAKTNQTHQINLKKLYELVAQAVEELFADRYNAVVGGLEKDYASSKLKGNFKLLELSIHSNIEKTSQRKRSVRQQRHL
ncbi:MAG: B12-binding domain-containing radical SAM protein [Kangiellaceae bacterium]|nr:B12-binding domain-containing radical SAM protein [Kangiellaceae bacterium]MCW9018123.1 B12-binding domain-containing radical SAM protein [Kangiellaceae bacterium]